MRTLKMILFVILAICFSANVLAETEIEHIKEMQSTGKSEQEVFEYIQSLEPKALIKLGREVALDREFSQSDLELERMTNIIMETYVKKADDISQADWDIRKEISNYPTGYAPEKWRQQLIRWFGKYAKEHLAVDDVIVVRYIDWLNSIVSNSTQPSVIREEAKRTALLLLSLQPETYLKHIRQLEADGKSGEAYKYIQNLEPSQALTLGKEVCLDKWLSQATGLEFKTDAIMKAYIKKINNISEVTKGIIREISSSNAPEKWRQQLIWWFAEYSEAETDHCYFDDENVALYIDCILALFKDSNQPLDIRIEANGSITRLMHYSRNELVIKGTEKEGVSIIREKYGSHLGTLLQLVRDMRLHQDVVASCIFSLACYYRMGVPESPEIRNKLMELFKNREKMPLKNQVALAEAIVETGNKTLITEDLLKLKEEIEQTEDTKLKEEIEMKRLRQRTRDLLKKQSLEGVD